MLDFKVVGNGQEKLFDSVFKGHQKTHFLRGKSVRVTFEDEVLVKAVVEGRDGSNQAAVGGNTSLKARKDGDLAVRSACKSFV